MFYPSALATEAGLDSGGSSTRIGALKDSEPPCGALHMMILWQAFRRYEFQRRPVKFEMFCKCLRA